MAINQPGTTEEILSSPVMLAEALIRVVQRTRIGFIYVLVVALSLSGMANAQILISSTPGVMVNLSPEHYYTIKPDVRVRGRGQLIVPIINGRETGTPLSFQISAPPGSEADMRIKLPPVLVAPDGSTASIDFTPISAFVVNTSDTANGLYINPNVPNTIAVPTGEIKILLGWNVQLLGQVRGTYSGFVRITAVVGSDTLKDSSTISVSLFDYPPINGALYQNYPNPFVRLTNFSFEIANQTKVTLVVSNLLGEEVGRPVDVTLANGIYNIPWSASSLPSGMYFCRIKTDYFTDVKKMVIQK